MKVIELELFIIHIRVQDTYQILIQYEVHFLVYSMVHPLYFTSMKSTRQNPCLVLFILVSFLVTKKIKK